MQVARKLAPYSQMPDRYPQGTGIKDTLFNCKDPPCSLLVSANIIYNHVSTGRGDFFALMLESCFYWGYTNTRLSSEESAFVLV
jgi:hypothetical protein